MEQLSLLCPCGKHRGHRETPVSVDAVFGVCKAHDLAEACVSARLSQLAERRVAESFRDPRQAKKMTEER